MRACNYCFRIQIRRCLEVQSRGVRRKSRSVARRHVPTIRFIRLQGSLKGCSGDMGVDHQLSRGDVSHSQIVICRSSRGAPIERHRLASLHRSRTPDRSRAWVGRSGRLCDLVRRCLEVQRRGVRRKSRSVARRHVPTIRFIRLQGSLKGCSGDMGVDHQLSRGDVSHSQIVICRSSRGAPIERHRLASLHRSRTPGRSRAWVGRLRRGCIDYRNSKAKTHVSSN